MSKWYHLHRCDEGDPRHEVAGRRPERPVTGRPASAFTLDVRVRRDTDLGDELTKVWKRPLLCRACSRVSNTESPSHRRTAAGVGRWSVRPSAADDVTSRSV